MGSPSLPLSACVLLYPAFSGFTIDHAVYVHRQIHSKRTLNVYLGLLLLLARHGHFTRSISCTHTHTLSPLSSLYVWSRIPESGFSIDFATVQHFGMHTEVTILPIRSKFFNFSQRQQQYQQQQQLQHHRQRQQKRHLLCNGKCAVANIARFQSEDNLTKLVMAIKPNAKFSFRS